jgi:nitrous oxidase accessory protein
VTGRILTRYRRRRAIFLRHCLVLLVFGVAAPARALPPLQLYVELTPSGGVLKPPPGRYAGPVVLRKPITLDGGGEVTLDGGGRGTVLSVKTDDCIVRGLQVVGSGDSHDRVDAGILVEADRTLVEDNRLEDVLFGIHLRGADDNLIRGNRISSRGQTPSLRGEGLRLWHSHNNRLESNDITGVRDLVITNSTANLLQGNTIRDSRIGLELVFSPQTEIRGNRFEKDSTGILVMYSNDVVVAENHLSDLRDVSGFAVSVKGSSQVRIQDNQILHCATGLSANAPLSPENILYLEGNRFAYNDVALYFYGEKGGHRIHDNRFENNLTDVRVSASTTAVDNDWRGNYWDTYRGVDLDGDGVGDAPHELHLYADRIWMDRPATRFFRGSPLLEVVDFMERLAPFSPPQMVLRDVEPRTR